MTQPRDDRSAERLEGPPIDPDVERSDLPARPRRAELRTLALISLGGVLGALARYGAGVEWPTGPGAFPWTTFAINITGSALLGALLAALDLRPDCAPLRPFLGTGIIGGFTTFSTYAVDNERLLRTGHVATAFADVGATLLVCAAATVLGDQLVRRSGIVGGVQR
jgi:CrcB protein